MCSLLAAVADYCGASSVCGAPTLRFHAAAGATNGPNVVPYSLVRLTNLLTLSQTYQLLTLSQTYQLTYLVLVLITLNQLTPLVCFTSFVLVSFPYFTYLLLVRLTNSPTDSSHSSSQRLLLRPSQPFSCTPLVCLFYFALVSPSNLLTAPGQTHQLIKSESQRWALLV